MERGRREAERQRCIGEGIRDFALICWRILMVTCVLPPLLQGSRRLSCESFSGRQQITPHALSSSVEFPSPHGAF